SGHGHEVDGPTQRRRVRAEQRLAELVDDTRAAQLGKRVPGRPRRDDRTLGQLVARAVMIRDDYVQSKPRRLPNLRDRRDAAVDGEHEPTALTRKPRERLAMNAVALVESRRQMPLDLSARLAQNEHRQRGRADPVRVVVAVDADALPTGNRRPDPLDDGGHVSE